MKIKLLILFLVVGMSNYACAQDDGVIMKGYVISLGGELFFSPRKDSNDIFKALNEKAFLLGTLQDGNEQIEYSLDGVGDSLEVFIETDDGKKYNVEMSYFYCTVRFLFAVTATNDFKILDNHTRDIIYSGRKYPFCSIWIRNRFISLIPSRIQDELKIINYYKRKNFNYPSWLRVFNDGDKYPMKQVHPDPHGNGEK